MSTWKTIKYSARERVARQKPLPDTELTVRPAAQIEVTNLEIVADDDRGYDPYNSTGEFCLEELHKFDD